MTEFITKLKIVAVVLVAGVLALVIWGVSAFLPAGNATRGLNEIQRAEIRQIVKDAVAGAVRAPAQSRAAGFSDSEKTQISNMVTDQLVNNPAVLRQALVSLDEFQKQEQRQVAVQSIRDNAKQIFRSDYSHVAGNEKGSVTMVEFFDYNCPYCKRSTPDVTKLLDTDSDLRVVLKEFPILGPGSVYASRAAIASRKQDKYWKFHLALMGNRGRLNKAKVDRIAADVGLDVEQLKKDMEAPEVAAAIAESHDLANKMGIRGTPAFIIADRLIPGALGYDALQAQISEVRKSDGCKEIC